MTGGTRFQLGSSHRLGFGRLDDLDRSMNLPGALLALFNFEGEADLRAKLAGDVFLERLVGAGENVHLHQMMDDLVGLEPELGGEVLDDDRRLDHDNLVAKLLGRERGIIGAGGSMFRRFGCGRRRGSSGSFDDRRSGRGRLVFRHPLLGSGQKVTTGSRLGRGRCFHGRNFHRWSRCRRGFRYGRLLFLLGGLFGCRGRRGSLRCAGRLRLGRSGVGTVHTFRGHFLGRTWRGGCGGGFFLLGHNKKFLKN